MKKLKETLLAIMLVSTLTTFPTMVQSISPHKRGPHMDYLHIINYGNWDAEFAALEAGEIDITDWPLNASWITRWYGMGLVPSAISLSAYTSIDAFEYDINTQKWPTGCEGLSAREGYTGTYTRGAYTWNMFHTRQRTDILYTPANRTIPWPYDPDATAEDALNGIASPFGNGSDYDPETSSWKVYFDENCLWDVSAWGMRLAIAYTTDKDYIIGTILEGLGREMRAWAARPGQEGFLDLGNLTFSSFDYHGPEGDVHVPSLIFSKNMSKAAELLDAAGFKDWDNNGIRNDPRKVAGPDKIYGTGDDVTTSASDLGTWANPDIIFYMRLEDPNREAAGLHLAEDLETLDVPIDEIDVDRAICFRNVMIEYNYHLYTGGYSFGVDIYGIQYDLWHSSQYWYPIGWSGGYQGFCHVDNDMYMEWVKYGSTLYGNGGVFPGVANGTYLQNKYVASIPLWTSASAMAYASDWEGVVNHAGYGISWGTGGVYFWSQYNMEKDGENTINWGFHSAPESCNPVISEWIWDYMVADSVYEGLLTRNPYNLAKDIPMLATSWSTGTWGPGGQYLYIDFTLKDNVTFHDGYKLRADDVKFSYEFYRDCGPGVAWGYASFAELENVTVTGPLSCRVFYTTGSVWTTHLCCYAEILNKRLWLNASAYYGWGYDRTQSPANRWPNSSSSLAVRDYLHYSMDAYDPADPNPGPDGTVDLAQDGTGPWVFVGIGGTWETIDLTAFRSHHMFQDEVEEFLAAAFNDRGNVNYQGSVNGYAATDRRVDEFDMIYIDRAMFTNSTHYTHGNGAGQYNEDCDFNDDTEIDILDLSNAGANYGTRGG